MCICGCVCVFINVLLNIVLSRIYYYYCYRRTVCRAFIARYSTVIYRNNFYLGQARI